MSRYSANATDFVFGQPTQKFGDWVELAGAAVDNRHLTLDVALEMIDRDPEGLGDLLLVQSQGGTSRRDRFIGRLQARRLLLPRVPAAPLRSDGGSEPCG
jgi:hypothetical protein